MMIEQLLLSLSFLFLSLEDPVKYNVVYDAELIQDLNDRENPGKNEMILSVGTSSSRFCSLSEYKNYIARLMKKEQQAVIQSSGTTRSVVGRPVLLVGSSGARHREQIIKDFTHNKVDKVGLIGIKEYHVQGGIPKIEWEITKQQKVISGYNCQYATGKLAGREYHVWFTTELPFPDGPWLLNGLPGLILEAVDSKGEVSFKVKSVTKSTHPNENVESFYKYDKCIGIKEKDYRKAVEMYIKDPEAYTQAQVSGAKLSVLNEESGDQGEVRKIKRYNPIELD